MSVKCPYCGSENVQATNMGKRTFAAIASGTVGLLTMPFMRGGYIGPAKETYKSICPSREYICLNDNCRRKFSEPTF